MDPASIAADWTPMSIGTLVTLIMGAIVTVIGAWKMAKIEAHVNSEKTALHEQAVAKDKEITITKEAALKEIALLREILEERKTTAALLAQAASHAVSAGAAVSPAGSTTAAAAIIETADNTKAIEKNTAKTDATIEQLKKSAT